MLMRKVWMNGNFIDEKEAKFSIYDETFMFGSVFEMTRSFNKKHFKLKEHIERLYKSAKYFLIDIPYTIDEVISFCIKTSEINEKFMEKNDEHRLMISLSRGTLSIYRNLLNQVSSMINLCIADFPLKYTVYDMDKYFNKGINVQIVHQKQIPFDILDPRIKHRNRLHFLKANIEASLSNIPNTWPLLLDSNNFITETSGSNFLIVKNNTIISPKDHNILNGISRKYILEELALQIKGISVKKDDITLYDCLDSDEMMVCATPFCILPCVSINGVKIGDGKRGMVTQELLNRWSNNVDLDIEKQIVQWNKQSGNNILGTSPYQFSKGN
jgi:branched-chain amino acid aminotransferase